MKLTRRDWDGSDPAALAGELRAAAPEPSEITADVAAVVDRVREGGDAAAIELTERLDGVRIERPALAEEERTRLAASVDSDLRTALEAAAANVRAVADAQAAAETIEVEPGQGQTVRVAEVAVGSAGIYVPGGRAPYPSTVLMGTIAARSAGCERVVVSSPPGPGGAPPAEIVAAAEIAGADAVYALGGAQAIAALAYGTETIEAVDVIAGPGGPWVQEAKLLVSRRVGIDGYAGPSELVVIGDGSVDRRWLALDLCAQAEHGDDGLLVAIGVDAEDLEALGEEIGALAAAQPTLPDAPVTLVAAPGVEAALALGEELAPEHLQLCCADAGRLAGGVRTAGCVFTGPHGATAFGDYAAGSNHVLPTGGAGRFTGPLGPATFRRRITVVGMTPRAAVELGDVVEKIAAAEGFSLHGASARARAAGARENEGA